MSRTSTPPPRAAFRADVVWLRADQIHPNPWNPNKQNAFQYAKLLESIEKYGFIDPLLVRSDELDYQIIGGEHRYRAGIDLGMDEFPCIIREVNDADARTLTLIDNELHGQADPTAVGELLREILDEESIEDLLVGLPYTEEILSAFIGQPSSLLPPPELSVSPPTGGEPTEGWVERTYRMPKSVAGVIDEAIRKAKAQPTDPDFAALEVIAAEFLAS